MSQKTHPTSLRIASKYKNFSSCWYSDYFYSEMLSYDLELRAYIQSICDQSKHLQGNIRLQNDYKRFFIIFFIFDARGIRYSTEKALRLPYLSLQKNRLRENSFLNIEKSPNFAHFFNPSKKISHKKNELQLDSLLLTQEGISSFFEAPNNFKNQVNLIGNKTQNKIDSRSEKSVKKSDNPFFKAEENYFGQKIKQEYFLQKQQIIKKKQMESSDVKRFTFHSFLEKNIQHTPFDSASIYPVKVLQEVQNAEFLAGEIVYLLQKRAHFRQIQSLILRKITKDTSIKGIRLSCSGRVGGRSKKAQKSKIQSIQWGETSLHVFSSKLDFASKSASTLFGKVGVKVWLCYK